MAKLKQYLSESEITDDLKGAYTKQSDGRYKLNDLDSSHSLVVAQAEVTDKADKRQKDIDNLTTERNNLKAEVEEMKAKPHVPAGQRLVRKEIAELGEAAQSAGWSKDELPNAKTELETLKSEKVRASRNETRAKAAKAAGLSAEKFTTLAESEDFEIEFEKVTEGGKEVEKPFAVTKDADGKPVKAAFPEFVEKHAKFSLVLDALKEKEKTYSPFPGRETANDGNYYESLRKEKEAENKQAAETQGASGFASAFGVKKN